MSAPAKKGKTPAKKPVPGKAVKVKPAAKRSPSKKKK
jgi:hypothetical protein